MMRASLFKVWFPPTRREFTLLEDAENLASGRRSAGHRFVEKERSAVALFGNCRSVGGAAGAGALSVTEQLRFPEKIRKGMAATVDGDVRPGGPQAELVDGTGDDLLAANHSPR